MKTRDPGPGHHESFKEVHVLRGATFDVEASSILALLGSNGAGKTAAPSFSPPTATRSV